MGEWPITPRFCGAVCGGRADQAARVALGVGGPPPPAGIDEHAGAVDEDAEATNAYLNVKDLWLCLLKYIETDCSGVL